MTANQLRYWELQETKRSNRAKERETRRANRTSEELTRAYQQGTLGLRAQELTENVRSHQANESISLASVQENVRHNVAYENEVQRHNLATEQLTSKQLDLSAATLNETIRSHKANESLAWGNLSELQRHNRVQEANQALQIQTDAQYKQAMAEQGAQRITLDTQHVANERQRVVNETYSRLETQRHNRAQEAVQDEQNELRGYEILIHGIESAFKVGSSVALAMAK